MSTTVSQNNASPTVTNDTPVATQVLENKSTQNVTASTATVKPKAFNAFGIQVIKGSITDEMDVFEATKMAYSNLVFKPLAVACMLWSFFYYYTSITGNVSANPYKLALTNIAAAGVNASYPMQALSSFGSGLFTFLHSYQIIVSKVLACGFPYLAKPSDYNFKYFLFLISFMLLADLDDWAILLASHLFLSVCRL
uniref:Uncharacterized protein n=1 Tax=Entomophthora virgavirus A TaxID=2592730 RepID=A0A7G3KFX8_9VIRU|nr:hypothetical protein [Entomophthora virgavirus A]